jgi:hypothetical protein
MLAVVVTLIVAVGCGGDEPSKPGSPTPKAGSAAGQHGGESARPGRLVEIGEGRSVFLH